MRGYFAAGLYQAKNVLNIGEVLRAAGNYNAAFIAITGKRYAKAKTDTMKAYRHIPLLEVDDLEKVIPHKCVPVAVDLVPDAKNIINFVHPESAFYIFGGEDRTLDDDILSFCKHKIYVPTNRCMNLAAAVNVIFYDRLSKSER